MKKFSLVLAALVCCLFVSVVSYTDSNISIMETYTGEESISLYIKGTDAEANINAQVGTAEAEVEAINVADLDVSMKTLIMLDNSLSIKKGDREKIAELLQNIISDRTANEQIAISTFSEDITYLCDYTNDYSTLKAAIDSIEYQDLETYLTDVLYDLISAELNDDDDVLWRIVIISDGVDNKSLGYTKEELYSLIEKNKLPIYTIGSKSKVNNDEQLENMFALSRRTGVASFLLEDIAKDQLLEIDSVLNEDRDAIKVVVKPADTQMDGSTKAVKIAISGNELSAECRMPHKIQVVEATVEPEPTVEPVVTPIAEPSPEPVIEEKKIPWGLIEGVVIVLILLCVIVAIVIIVIKKNKDKNKFESVDDALLNSYQNRNVQEVGKTEIISNLRDTNDDGSTCMIWNNQEHYKVILTDINSPAKSVQIPLTTVVSIGRQTGCDAVFDYEKSVSGKHCEIRVSNGKFYLKDLQSSNGTFVNDSKVLTEVEIFSGNIIKLGRLQISFEIR